MPGFSLYSGSFFYHVGSDYCVFCKYFNKIGSFLQYAYIQCISDYRFQTEFTVVIVNLDFDNGLLCF